MSNISDDIVNEISRMIKRIKYLEGDMPEVKWFVRVPQSLKHCFGEQVNTTDDIVTVIVDHSIESRVVDEVHESHVVVSWEPACKQLTEALRAVKDML